ncbi:geranylgeranyl reductase family [Corynebacterium pollutisoli]|uniref:Geranylgeranyl reductase family n=1 Tax=Corynebacterium pollutisoli TaxID=1610489 RepID=A0A1X7KC18_9CORY|nr:geranylgeranyl reductase family protein [Corynebacterium pollutisoli]SMG38750.1 geranylgeranyl reductase family [Corynebacterium pollutisoli]
MSVVDVLVVGAGPAGAAAAIHAADTGLEVLLVDAATFPRDKTCGDGLTPRAIHSLARLGLADEVTRDYRNKGLKLRGFGGSVTAPWPEGHYGTVGSAMPRTEFDHLVVRAAVARGATLWEDATATAVTREGRSIGEVTVRHGGVDKQVRARWILVADGVRSTFGKLLGREWHRGEVYGIAARSYCTSPMSTEPWIHSDVELLDDTGTVQPGYGWIFPLGDGRVNLGAGALSTDARPAKVNTKKLLAHYAARKRQEWQLGPEQDVASALLPMGGAVSNVAGPNWMLIGDAAALVNPLNGEGIDYGLESAEMAVGLLQEGRDLTLVWPHLLRETYGEAFLLARTAARLLTYPTFLPLVGPLGLRGPVGAVIMPAAARLMGNLITDEDRDLIARAWRLSGAAVSRARRDTPLWSTTA